MSLSGLSDNFRSTVFGKTKQNLDISDLFIQIQVWKRSVIALRVLASIQSALKGLEWNQLRGDLTNTTLHCNNKSSVCYFSIEMSQYITRAPF